MPASAEQADIVVSAEATTCHVVAALRIIKSESVPLVTGAHADEAGVYDSCVEKMVNEHLSHHNTMRHSTREPERDD